MTINIKQASSRDLDVIISMSKYTIDKCYRDWLEDNVVDDCLASDKLDRYLVKHSSHTWLLTLNSKVVAFAICIENMIDFILVNVDHQGQGLGKRLLNSCEQILFEDYTTIAVESFKYNARANSFFTTNGWKLNNQYLDSRLNMHKLIFTKEP